MDAHSLWLLFAAVLLVAFLYSSVGHAGASGYIAVMSLLGLSVSVIKPTALILNIFVAIIGSYQFWRAGYFSWSLFWPFALLSIPAAYFGGYLHVPVQVFKVMLGIVLWLSAVRLFFRQGDPPAVKAPSGLVSLGVEIGRAHV